MTPEQHAETIIQLIVEKRDYLVDVELQARYKQLIAAAIRDHVEIERGRAARLAWKMQMESFGGGTAIGNAIRDGAMS